MRDFDEHNIIDAVAEGMPGEPSFGEGSVTNEAGGPLAGAIVVDGDKHLDREGAFGVKNSLIQAFDCRQAGAPAGGVAPSRDYFLLSFDFTMGPRLR